DFPSSSAAEEDAGAPQQLIQTPHIETQARNARRQAINNNQQSGNWTSQQAIHSCKQNGTLPIQQVMCQSRPSQPVMYAGQQHDSQHPQRAIRVGPQPAPKPYQPAMNPAQQYDVRGLPPAMHIGQRRETDSCQQALNISPRYQTQAHQQETHQDLQREPQRPYQAINASQTEPRQRIVNAGPQQLRQATKATQQAIVASHRGRDDLQQLTPQHLPQGLQLPRTQPLQNSDTPDTAGGDVTRTPVTVLRHPENGNSVHKRKLEEGSGPERPGKKATLPGQGARSRVVPFSEVENKHWVFRYTTFGRDNKFVLRCDKDTHCFKGDPMENNRALEHYKQDTDCHPGAENFTIDMIMEDFAWLVDATDEQCQRSNNQIAQEEARKEAVDSR
ncbi:hypothetical protein GE09DRAFT_1263065, partial [Coniochaeta sp. 2T2.1]